MSNLLHPQRPSPWLARLLGLVFVAASAMAAGENKQHQLRIVDANILDSEDGYALPEGSFFYPGEKVYARFEIDGYRRTIDNRMRVRYEVRYLGPRGAPFAEPEKGEIREELAPQDDKWRPIVRGSPGIPYHAEAGTYRVEVAVYDFLSDTEVTATLPFDVKGLDIDATSGLRIRDFAFRRGESGEKLAEPHFRQGETLFGSFVISGFSLTEENAYDVASTLEVYSAEGERMYSFQPHGDAGETFYPRQWLPAKFRIELDKDIPTGEYAVRIQIHDRISGNRFETRQPFSVR